MKRRIMKFGIACGAMALSTMLCFAGCASGEVQDTATPEPTQEATQTPTPEPTEEPTETPEPSPEPSYVTFGTESPDAYAVVFTNGTGQDITGIKVRNSDKTEFGQNMIPDGTVVLTDETFRLCIPKENASEAAASGAAEDTSEEPAAEANTSSSEIDERDIQFNETYDIELTFGDGKTATLYDLGLKDMDTALIAYSTEESVAYVSYVSTVTKETVSTLDAQIAHSRDEAAAALEEENQNTEAAAPATSKTSASQSSSNESSGGASSSGGGESSSSGGSESSGSGSSGGGGSSPSYDEEESSGDGGSYDEPSYEESEPEQGIGECIEDNIVWND